ncbi:MAG: hydroxyphenylacetyl-CoA thioesterase PaaI [Candidatus Eremiobacteraeota bacterium]|nr:hydroxyphenylacetyl-CoA thioesterase PaaI [Candidatus Eremiobacteraeota bacterium]
MYARDRVARDLAIEIIEVRAGYARCEMTVAERMLNGHDLCHGGYIFTLADTAFAYACNARNHVNVALQCSISFAAPAREGDRLAAVCEERVKSNRTGTYDVTVTGASGAVLALFRGTSYQVNARVVRD